MDLLEQVMGCWVAAAEAGQYSRGQAAASLRSPEERFYHKLLCDAFVDPGPVVSNVTRWVDRGEVDGPVGSPMISLGKRAPGGR